MNDIAPGLLLVTALRRGGVLVARPRGRVHLFTGRLTRSGVSVPAGASPICGAYTRRLRALGKDALSGRRVCRRCTALLPVTVVPSCTTGGRCTGLPVNVEARRALFYDLTVEDFAYAARWTRSRDEVHQVSGLFMRLIDPTAPGAREVDQLLTERGRFWWVREMSPEERERLDLTRENEAYETQRLLAQRARDQRIAVAMARRDRGQYLMPHERELINSA